MYDYDINLFILWAILKIKDLNLYYKKVGSKILMGYYKAQSSGALTDNGVM